MLNKKITIQDVAEIAKVHKSTVSRVLNGSINVNIKTKEKIEKAIESLGYTPNSIARSLALGKNKVIGLVVSENHLSDIILNPFFPTILKGITVSAEAAGNNILLITSKGSDFNSYMEVIKKNTVDGLIIVGPSYEDSLSELLNKQGIPYVFIGKFDSIDHCYVGTDNVLGGYMAAQYLINLNHKNIRLMVGEVNGTLLSHNIDRIAGFKKAFEEYGLSFSDDFIVKTPTEMENGYHFIKNYLKNEQPTGLILSNEVTAMACINALLDEGYNIPKDISLIAFGDSDFFRNIRPRLTTISQNFEWMGKTAVNMLLTQVNGLDSNPQAIVTKPELVIRDSTIYCNL
jgi:DNA-binding LacI/PurR family transcriptional regulator